MKPITEYFISRRIILTKKEQGFFSKFDFTYLKYTELCRNLIQSDLDLLTVENYLSRDCKPDKFVILRHDIDDESDLNYALKMAKTEHDLGFHTTYYFRICDNVFDEDTIRTIANMGHEIGYHYEVLGEAEGNYEKAIELFEKHLSKIRTVCEVKTIAQHGGPLRNCLNIIKISNLVKLLIQYLRGENIFDKWESKKIWDKYDFRDYGIIGEPYLSIDFNEVLYLSDTNRTWIDTKYRLKDKTKSNNLAKIRKTDDILELIRSEKQPKIHMLVHPSNWKQTFSEWIVWYFLQQIRNIGKKTLLILTKRV